MKMKFILKLELLVFLIIFILLIKILGQRYERGPIIFIISPLNKTYRVKNIILNVSFNETIFRAADSFDNGQKIVECYNCKGYIRYDLKFDDGVHTIRVYATDYKNNTRSASVTFSVKTEKP